MFRCPGERVRRWVEKGEESAVEIKDWDLFAESTGDFQVFQCYKEATFLFSCCNQNILRNFDFLFLKLNISWKPASKSTFFFLCGWKVGLELLWQRSAGPLKSFDYPNMLCESCEVEFVCRKIDLIGCNTIRCVWRYFFPSTIETRSEMKSKCHVAILYDPTNQRTDG